MKEGRQIVNYIFLQLNTWRNKELQDMELWTDAEASQSHRGGFTIAIQINKDFSFLFFSISFSWKTKYVSNLNHKN